MLLYSKVYVHCWLLLKEAVGCNSREHIYCEIKLLVSDNFFWSYLC